MSAQPIPLSEWQDEMEARGKLDCKFVCPACGNEASPNDFKAAGADLQRAPQECIGRVSPKVMAEGKFTAGPLGGCDWAAFGLIDICKVHVDTGEKQIPVFAFASSTPSLPQLTVPPPAASSGEAVDVRPAGVQASAAVREPGINRGNKTAAGEGRGR